jgi:hypothetical protein
MTTNSIGEARKTRGQSVLTLVVSQENKANLMVDNIWELQLVGDRSDLDRLSEAFGGCDTAVTRSGDEFVLTSKDFSMEEDARDVQRIAIEKLKCVIGACKLAPLPIKSIKTGAIYERHADGRRTAHMCIEPIELHIALLSVTTIKTFANGKVEESGPAQAARSVFQIAECDKALAMALSITGRQDLDWYDLYKIWEVINSDVGGEQNVISRR